MSKEKGNVEIMGFDSLSRRSGAKQKPDKGISTLTATNATARSYNENMVHHVKRQILLDTLAEKGEMKSV
jgi:hypothetical protein